MKPLYLTIPLTLLLCACSATSPENKVVEKIDYIDLSSAELRDSGKDYWNIFKRVEPLYPIEAARKGLAGCVELVTMINQEGKAQGYKILSSYPQKLFDKAAVKSLNLWKWLPAENNKNKQPILTHIRMDFMLESKDVSKKYLKNCPPTEEKFLVKGKVYKRTL